MTVLRFRPPLYPIALPLAFVLNFWSVSAVHPGGLVRTLLVVVVVSLVICVVAAAIAGRTLGGQAAFAFLVGLIAPPQSFLAPASFAIALLVLAVGVANRDRPIRFGPSIDRTMLALTTILVLAVGIRIVTAGSLSTAWADIQVAAAPRASVAPPQDKHPDIVMVMLDGFPGDAAATRAAAAGSPYDADAFPDALLDLGFHVQRNSNSNYLLTPMTLASMFGMRHLVDIPELPREPIHDAGADALFWRTQLNESAALDALHEAGYEIVWVDAGYNHIEARRVDRLVEPGQPNQLELRLLDVTAAGGMLSTAAPDLFSGLQRNRVVETLADIPLLVDEPHTKPRFTFVHVPSPHAPWVFAPDGSPRTERIADFFSDNVGGRGISRDEALRRAFDQATFVADRTAQEIATLVDRPEPPVVVVFSDHGTGSDLSFEEPATTDIVERSSNVLATLTPGQPDLFEAVTTPVNVFPTLFEAYLGVIVPRQPDTVYAWSGSEFNLFPVEMPVRNSP